MAWFSRGDLLRADALSDTLISSRGAAHAFDYISPSRHAGLLARTDTADCFAELQAAIDGVEAAGGGTLLLPAAHFKISRGLVIDDNRVAVVGAGSSYTQQGISPHRDEAATRIYWDTTSTPQSGEAIVKFVTPPSVQRRTGGGLRGIMLDGMTVLPRGLWLHTWNQATFVDVFAYACTEDQFYTSVVDYALSTGPADTLGNTFVNCHASTFGGSGWYLTNTARGWRLTGGSSVNSGNSCFNTFLGCGAYLSKGDAWTLENTDNNRLIACSGGAAYGATSGYDLIFGSADQDSSNRASKSVARYNFVLGCEFAVHCRASQTGGGSSHSNLILTTRSNGKPAPTLETGAGGSDNGKAIWLTTNEFQMPGFGVDNDGDVIATRVAALNYANDAAAAAGGVPLYGLYHNAGAVRVRIT